MHTGCLMLLPRSHQVAHLSLALSAAHCSLAAIFGRLSSRDLAPTLPTAADMAAEAAKTEVEADTAGFLGDEVTQSSAAAKSSKWLERVKAKKRQKAAAANESS